MKQLTEIQQQTIVKKYQNLVPMIVLAKKFNVTRQCIYKVLKRNGIPTDKESSKTLCICPICGVSFLRHRCRIRKAKTQYCSEECYHSYFETLSETYKPSSYYSRIARETILKYFEYNPKKGHILHHINKDVSDNRPSNLMVFRSQGEHVRYHRGFEEQPIWDGRIKQGKVLL